MMQPISAWRRVSLLLWVGKVNSGLYIYNFRADTHQVRYRLAYSYLDLMGDKLYLSYLHKKNGSLSKNVL